MADSGKNSPSQFDPGDDGNEEGDDEFDPSICAPGSEHTGRWARKEHELFLEALKKFGKVGGVKCRFLRHSFEILTFEIC